MSGMFWDNLNTFKNAYERMLADICMKFDLARAEADIILFLSKSKTKDTQTDIVNYTGYSKSNVSTAVRKLELSGYLKTIVLDNNRRTVHLSLLEKSSKVVKYSQKRKKEFETEVFMGFTEEETKALSLLIDKVSINIGKKDS